MADAPVELVVRVPGKLMLAGEYAAVQPGGLALALAVRRHLFVEVAPAGRPELTSELLGWVRRPTGRGAPDDPYLDAALAAGRGALAELGLAERPLHLTVRSELGGGGQPKGGLGSSAALTVAVVAGLLAAHGLLPRTRPGEARKLLLGLALAAHLRAQGWQGSGYDVATVLAGGVAALRVGQPLAERAMALAEAGASWTAQGQKLVRCCELTRQALPAGLLLARVASGQEARTPALLAAARRADPTPLRDAAQGVLAALEAGSAAALIRALEEAQQAFERWDEVHRLGLMTPVLQGLAREVRAAGLVPRVSGAGGGDSLLVLGEDGPALQRLAGRLAAQGRPLVPVEVDEQGAVLV